MRRSFGAVPAIVLSMTVGMVALLAWAVLPASAAAPDGRRGDEPSIEGVALDGAVRDEAAFPVQVTVHPEEAIGPVRPELFGAHLAYWNETIVQNGAIRPTFLRKLAAAGLGYIVYPGGNAGLDFVWNDLKLPAELNTDHFVEILSRLGAAGKISLNPHAAPQLAADWIRYVNVVKGAGIRYWEVADEPYLTLDTETFIAKMKAFVPVLKAADPSIRIVANVSAADPGFTKRVIAEVGHLIDVYSIHFLPLRPSAGVSPGSPYILEEAELFFEALLKSPALLREQLATVRGWVEAVYPERPVEYQVGSYAPVWSGPEMWTVNALPAGLWVADLLGTMAEERVTGAAIWAMMNPYPPGQGDFGLLSPEFKPYVSYYPFVLYARHFGTELVAAHSTSERLSIYASRSEGGDDLYVMLINKAPDRAATITFDLRDFVPRGDAAVWILDGPTIADHPYDYGLRKERVRGVRGRFEWTVPSYSAAALVIPGAGSGTSLLESPNLALDKVATASSSALYEAPAYFTTYEFLPGRAVDGDLETRWASKIFRDDDEWFEVDLGQRLAFDTLRMEWEYWPIAYTVKVSDDGRRWTEVADEGDVVQTGTAPRVRHVISLPHPVSGRYLRIRMTERPAGAMTLGTSTWTPQAYSLWEFEVTLR